jgi:hypothetical protein
MKQARRQELKTNELSVYLRQIYEWLNDHSTQVIWGVVIAAAILVIALYARQRAHAKREAGWQEYEAIRKLNPLEDEAAIARAQDLVAEYGDQRPLGIFGRETLARMLYVKGMQLDPLSESEEQIELLKQSKAAYQDMLEAASDDDSAVQRAHVALAAIEESLAIHGQGRPEEARKHYEALTRAEPALFGDLAKQQLQTLEDRLADLPMVATRPAAEPETEAVSEAEPETAEAPAEPAAETPPAPPETAPGEPSPAPAEPAASRPEG